VLWLRSERSGAVEDGLRESLLARMEAGGRERCEGPGAFSERGFRGRGRGEPPPASPTIVGAVPAAPAALGAPPFVYDSTFHSADPAARSRRARNARCSRETRWRASGATAA
jgi:hypothetical protein